MNIISNGSKWAGQPLDSIDQLIAVLETEILDPAFDLTCNGFVTKHQGLTCAFGNFLHVSHVFNIQGTTDEMKPLVDALRKATQRPEYLAALERAKQFEKTEQSA